MNPTDVLGAARARALTDLEWRAMVELYDAKARCVAELEARNAEQERAANALLRAIVVNQAPHGDRASHGTAEALLARGMWHRSAHGDLCLGCKVERAIGAEPSATIGSGAEPGAHLGAKPLPSEFYKWARSLPDPEVSVLAVSPEEPEPAAVEATRKDT